MNTGIKKVNKGFTLLEILLVIAAIGILAAIVLVAINPTRQINQARQAGINSEKNAIAKAIEQYVIDNQTYPTDITETSKAICNNTVTTNCANLSSLVPTYIANIPSDNTYTVAKGNDGRAYVNTTETAANLTCPTGYIRVPGNSLYQTKDFCVMKYEAKAGSSTVPATTQAAGLPHGTSQNLSIAACNLNNTGGVTGYSLIDNAEYMTIARNIEAQGSNWTGGSVGSGGLFKGHSDENPGGVLEASTDDSNGYLGTGNDINNGVEQKRTHTLSNGQVIWDLSGNLWEWTSDTIMMLQRPVLGDGLQEWTNFNSIGSSYGSLSYDLTRPSNSSWNSSQNMGKYFDNTNPNQEQPKAFMRGGVYHGLGTGGGTGPYAKTGIFTLLLDYGPDNWSAPGPVTGRCIFR